MTALFPDRKDRGVNGVAMARWAADKKNEAARGCEGAWTAHPDQTQGEISQSPAPNQLAVRHPDFPRQPDLTPSPAGAGAVTAAGTRDAIRTLIEYRFGVLSGLGARMIKGYDRGGKLIGNFMEDLATDRIYRLMVAQRVRHAVVTDDGIRVTEALVASWFDLELAKILGEQPGADGAMAARYQEASRWSQQMIKDVAKAPSPGPVTLTLEKTSKVA